MARKKRQFFSERPVLSLKHLLRRAEAEAKKTDIQRGGKRLRSGIVQPIKVPSKY